VSQLTTHVLDTARGRPAAGVLVALRRGGEVVAEALTDADGRASNLGPERLEPGDYTLRFDTAAYFGTGGVAGFYPEVVVSFTVSGADHYHVPLLLSPFGYTTYRGS
jgi:5-hydroxyisourate hydrolase